PWSLLSNALSAGPLPARPWSLSWNALSAGPLAARPRARLLQPQAVNQDVPLRIPLVAVDVLGQEVDLLRVVHVDPGSLRGVRVVDLRPDRGRPGRVAGLHGLGLGDLAVDQLVAERGDVRAGVAVGMDGPAAQQHVQEVRRGRIVLVPGGQADVPLTGVRRVLDERVLDARRQQLRAGLVADRV